MANLYDTHCHIDLFEDQNSVIYDINNLGSYTIAVTNLPPLFTSLKNKINSKFIRIALGFHPELIEDYKHHIPKMWHLLPDARYIGEVGLDYKKGGNKQLQQSFLETLIEKSNEYDHKIFSFHSRGGENDLLTIIGDKFLHTAILHWFSGSNMQIDNAISKGAYFSINYSMMQTNKGKSLITRVPKSKILIETDAPFVSISNKPFLPSDIHYIISSISKIWGNTYDDAKEILWNNFKNILFTRNNCSM